MWANNYKILKERMSFLAKKLQIIIGLLFVIMLTTINPSKAQSITTNNDNILSISISCPDNPQCIYSGKRSPINILITNNSNQNLEIPLEAIRTFLMSYHFQNIQTKNGLASPSSPGFIVPNILKKLTLLPAHEAKVIKVEYSEKKLKKAFKEAHSNQVIFYVKTPTLAYFQGSKEPIGNYNNGKFEPKWFILTTERVITKK